MIIKMCPYENQFARIFLLTENSNSEKLIKDVIVKHDLVERVLKLRAMDRTNQKVTLVLRVKKSLRTPLRQKTRKQV